VFINIICFRVCSRHFKFYLCHIAASFKNI
jgi:hypothetical protein